MKNPYLSIRTEAKGHGKRPRVNARLSYRKVEDATLVALLREHLMMLRNRGRTQVTAEEMAKHFEVPVHQTKTAFMRLNQEGLMVRLPHEGKIHEDFGYWSAKHYMLTSPEEVHECKAYSVPCHDHLRTSNRKRRKAVRG